jgi:nitrite reductase/ring-hydroxylating ferredoxin subunit
MTQEDSRNVPDYAHARTKRQKQRAAGLHPDYWYPVLWSHELASEQVREVVFWGRSLAIYRGSDGRARALENRCAHRQLKLSLGQVEGCRLSCSYHGWKYDESGRCVLIEHSLFGHKMPNARVEAFPVQERYGVVWVFPGDPAVASSRALPEIPEWADDSGWGKLSIDFTWKAHHSIIIDNRKTTNTNAMRLGYAYPYQWSSTDEKIKHWCFVLPIDRRTTRVFFLFYFSPEMLKIPLLPVLPPRPAISAIMPIVKRLLVRPLLDEDGVAVEAEQAGYEAHFDRPVPDLNPVVHAFQELTVRKWEEHLDGRGRSGSARGLRDVGMLRNE